VGEVKLKGIKVNGKMKGGKFVAAQSYTSVSDRLKRGTKRRIVRGKRI
jgi:hypothetical protein